MNTLIEIELTGSIAPDDLPRLIEKVGAAASIGEVARGVVIISGRAPVWAFAALTHHFHPVMAVATYDPRLGGGVVVASHTRDVSVGEVIAVEEARTITVRFP